MTSRPLSQREDDAILAALRLLATSLKNGSVAPNDGDIGDILTNSGLHAGLDSEGVHDLADKLAQNHEIRVIER